MLTGTNQLERMDPVLCSPSKSVPDTRPPFVVRHADDSLLSERNFCGKPVGASNKVYFAEKHSSGGDSGLRTDGGVVWVKAVPGVKFTEGGTGDSASARNSPRLGQRSPCVSPSPKTTPLSLRRSALQGSRADRAHSPAPHGSPHWAGRREDLVTKYLDTPSGDCRREFGSLAQTIEEKIERLKRECCECLVCKINHRG